MGFECLLNDNANDVSKCHSKGTYFSNSQRYEGHLLKGNLIKLS